MSNKAISLAVQSFCDRPELSDEEVVQQLVRAGIDPLKAARIVEFTPAVFVRLLLGRIGVRFSESFVRQAGKFSSTQQPLESQPVWVEVNEFANTRGRTLGKQEWLAIAGRSAEFEAVNRLLNGGASPHAIVLTPLCLQWPEEGPPHNRSPSVTD
jgi:hypothetical protein